MKKILVLILGLVMCLCLVACGDSASSDGDDSSPVTKKDLQTANSNAKFIFTTANNYIADYAVDNGRDYGKAASMANKSCAAFKVAKVSDLKNSDNELDKALYKELKDEGITSGELYIEVNEDADLTLAQWTVKDGCVGQYPDCEPDYKVENTIGEKFEPSKKL